MFNFAKMAAELAVPPTEQALSNELIMKKIISFIPTSDLVLRVNRLNRKWNKVSDKLVIRKRIIVINNNNIFRYCDVIKSGAVGHQNIALELNFDLFEAPLTEFQARKIAYAFSEIGGFVRSLKLQSTFRGSSSAKVLQGKLINGLLINCKNIVSLYLKIELASRGGRLSPLINLAWMQPLVKLKTLSLKLDLTLRDRLALLNALLKAALSIEEVKLHDHCTAWKALDFKTLDQQEQFPPLFYACPSFVHKISAFSSLLLDDELGNYLCSNSKGLGALKRLRIPCNTNVSAVEGVLNKVKDHLLELELHLSMGLLSGNDVNWVQPVLNLPAMKNLEVLILRYNEVPKWPALKFWDCPAEGSALFPKLRQLSVSYGSGETSRLMKYKSVVNIFLTMFRDSFAHPVFPGVLGISANISELVATIKRNDPSLFQIMRRYLPNLVD